jgi:hypothetical protein
MAVVLRGLELRRPGTIIELQDELFEHEIPTSPAYLSGPGSSVCCIGSPRACYVAEFMLAEMFGVGAFDPRLATRVPLSFVWAGRAPCHYPSSFRVTADQLQDIDAALAGDILDGRLWGALRVGDKIFPESRRLKDERWTSHGVVLTQGRTSGQVWVVLAGLSGPDTFGCARVLATAQSGAVPEASRDRQPIRWDIVESTVEERPGGHGDTRVVVSQRVVANGIFGAVEE